MTPTMSAKGTAKRSICDTWTTRRLSDSQQRTQYQSGTFSQITSAIVLIGIIHIAADSRRRQICSFRAASEFSAQFYRGVASSEQRVADRIPYIVHELQPLLQRHIIAPRSLPILDVAFESHPVQHAKSARACAIVYRPTSSAKVGTRPRPIG